MSVRLIFIVIFAFCLIFGLCVFTACFDGGDDDSDDDANDDDDDDDTDDDDTDDDSEPDTWGGIGISEGYSSSNLYASSYYCGVGASFYDPDECDEWGYGEPDDEEGDCKLYHWSDDTETCHTLSAGRVTVTGAIVSPIHLDPVFQQDYGYYYYKADVDFLDINNLFDENDTFSAHVAGGSGIGPLDVSVDAPPMISVTKPSKFDSLDSLPSSAMTFQWKKGGAEKVFLTLSTYNVTKTTVNGVVIVCEAPDEQGEIVVSGDLMEELLDDPDTMSVMLSKSNNEISEGSKPVYFTASTYRQRTYIQVK